jgi:hypothetical protein
MMTMSLCRSTFVAISAALLLAAGCGSTPDESASSTTSAVTSPWFETVYRTFEEATAGRVTVKTRIVQEGRLSGLRHVDLATFLGLPGYSIEPLFRGASIGGVQVEARAVDGSDEWTHRPTVDAFDGLGRAVDDAGYRVVRVDIGGDVAPDSYRALEACWLTDGYCLVMDPVLDDVDAYARDRAQMPRGARHLPDVGPASRASAPAATTADGPCLLTSTLTSAPRSTASVTYPAVDHHHNNIYGIEVVATHLGEASVQLSCSQAADGSCRIDHAGSVGTSSCQATIPFTCACDSAPITSGTAGNTVKVIAETACTYRTLITSEIHWSRQGEGLGVTIKWDASGSVDANGASLIDSCSQPG